MSPILLYVGLVVVVVTIAVALAYRSVRRMREADRFKLADAGDMERDHHLREAQAELEADIVESLDVDPDPP